MNLDHCTTANVLESKFNCALSRRRIHTHSSMATKRKRSVTPPPRYVQPYKNGVHLVARRLKRLKDIKDEKYKARTNVLNNRDLVGLLLTFVPNESLLDLKRANKLFQARILSLPPVVERWNRGVLYRLRRTYWLILRFDARIDLDTDETKFIESHGGHSALFAICVHCKAQSTIFGDIESAADFFALGAATRSPSKETVCHACSLVNASHLLDLCKTKEAIDHSIIKLRAKLEQKVDALETARESWDDEFTYDAALHDAEMRKCLKQYEAYDPAAESEYESTDDEEKMQE